MLQLFRNATDKFAVLFRLALTHVPSLKCKPVVHGSKRFSRSLPTFPIANPLCSDSLASMPRLKSAITDKFRDGTAIDRPKFAEKTDTAKFAEVPEFHGITDIHTFNSFHSFYSFLRKTFFHTRYVLVTGKDTEKVSMPVYNLSIANDESYVIPLGIVHNCRCTVVQVRKSRYPATPHDEAMSLGEEALQRDTKGMFRFNPGKQEKAVPDYNPYTISRCRDCDIAKGKAKLAKAFIPDNELCQACQLLRSCLEHKNSERFREYKKSIINDANVIYNRECQNLQTGQFYQTKKSLKRGLAHAYNVEEVEMFERFETYVSKLSFIRPSKLGEVKDMSDPKDIANIQKKIHRGVTGYNVYEVELNGEMWEIKTEVFKNKAETLYVAVKKGG